MNLQKEKLFEELLDKIEKGQASVSLTKNNPLYIAKPAHEREVGAMIETYVDGYLQIGDEFIIKQGDYIMNTLDYSGNCIVDKRSGIKIKKLVSYEDLMREYHELPVQEEGSSEIKYYSRICFMVQLGNSKEDLGYRLPCYKGLGKQEHLEKWRELGSKCLEIVEVENELSETKDSYNIDNNLGK
ncbi:MAG: hypothetical protein IJ008_00750 [Clostridia bacterium]|nr:hypothetical protein [Clostridia bacterium]